MTTETWHIQPDGKYKNLKGEIKSQTELNVYNCIRKKEDPEFELIRVLYDANAEATSKN